MTLTEKHVSIGDENGMQGMASRHGAELQAGREGM